MYGIDLNTYWNDYDLISAYTTILSEAGDPDYNKGVILTEALLAALSEEEILYSYTYIKCKFQFPSEVKYLSIPCYLDETTTVYPLKGEAVLTGAEYLLSQPQKCIIEFEEGYYIPFKKSLKPFELIIKEI
jgi:hypothetical protein